MFVIGDKGILKMTETPLSWVLLTRLPGWLSKGGFGWFVAPSFVLAITLLSFLQPKALLEAVVQINVPRRTSALLQVPLCLSLYSLSLEGERSVLELCARVVSSPPISQPAGSVSSGVA